MPEVPERSFGDAVPMAREVSGDAIEASLRLGFGAAAIISEILGQIIGKALGRRVAASPAQGNLGVDAVLGFALGSVRTGLWAAQVTVRFAAPVTSTAKRLILEPPLVAASLQPITQINALARSWRAQRTDLAMSALRSGQLATPVIVESAARMLNINQLITTVIDQIDMDALALELIDRVRVEPLVAQVLSKVDIVEAVGRVMDELPTDKLVAEVLSHLDMEALITSSLEQINLADIVVEQVDLAMIVNAALDRIDITSIVMERVDLPLVANTVIEEIDLAGTIRDSTGSVATEMVHGARISSVDADRAVARLVDRFTLRRKNRTLEAPGDPESAAPQDAAEGSDS